MTRRLISAACVLLAATGVLRAQDALQSLSAKLESNTAQFGYSFVTRGSQTPFSGDGTAAIRGLCYHLEGNGLDIRCDGKVRYTADSAAGEMVIEDADGEALDFLSNPAILLRDIGSNFKVSSTAGGAKGEKSYNLVPVEDQSVSSLTIVFADAVPVRGVLNMNDGSSVEFTVSDFKFTGQTFPWSFTKEELAGYKTVTDLR